MKKILVPRKDLDRVYCLINATLSFDKKVKASWLLEEAHGILEKILFDQKEEGDLL